MTATSVTPSTKPLRAYSVQETEEMTGGIIFARHAITARKWGANEYGNGDLSDVTCCRAPWADKFAEDGDVPVRVALNHGWRFECQGCGRTVDEGGLKIEDAAGNIVGTRPASGVIGTMRSTVYCCAECESEHLANERAKKDFGEEVLERLREYARTRLGPLTFTSDAFKAHAYVTGGKGEPLIVQDAVVSFEFPGQEIAPATLRWEEDRTRMNRIAHRWLPPFGPWEPNFSVCYGDRKAFQAFVAPRRMIRGMSAATALAPSLSGRN